MSAIEQPWLSNPEWCSRRVHGTTTSNPATSRTSNIWITGVFALVVGGTGLLIRGQDLWSHPNPRNATLLIFPAIAAAFLGWALLLNVRARKFGATYLEMESVPFFVGQRLRGTIHSSGLRHGETIRLRLNCVRRTKSRSHTQGVSSSGAKVSFDQLVWRDERFVSGQAQAGTGRGIVVPVEFSIPQDAPTTNPTNPDDSIFWNLEAWAPVRSADFLQNFEIPVFSAAGDPIRPAYQPTDVNRYAPMAVSLPDHPLPPTRQVTMSVSEAGGTGFLFAANRHWAVAWGASAAFCIWTAIVRYFLWLSDPLALALFMFADLLLLYWAVWSWFSKSSAVFSRDGVAIRTSLFGVGSVKHIAYDDIRDITAPITSQWGQGSQAVPLYGISLITRSQGTITVASSLRDPAEAGFVIKKMKEEMERSHFATAIH